MPLDAMTNPWDRRGGVAMVDDFVGFGGVLSTNTGQYFSQGNRWITYQTANTLLTNVALTPTPASIAPTSVGAIRLGCVAGVVDNDEVSMQWGGHELTPFGTYPFAVIPGISGDLVFEARFKVESIAATIGNFFIGLAGAAGVAPVATGVPITGSDAFVTTLSLLGFGRLAAATTGAFVLDYERASGAVASKTAGTLVAATYIKAGFRYDSATKTVSQWIDGVELTAAASKVSAAVTAATPWPNDYMTPVITSVQTDGTTGLGFTPDWVACAQLPPSPTS
jgi:uncharacterized membrane protein YtjA (UPF0391 family)